MIDQDKMRALASRIRHTQADCDESLQAAHAIYALVAALQVAEGERDDLRTELEAAAADKRDALAFRDLMAKVIREIDDGEYSRPYRGTENAPMHGHKVPGIWDSDNGAKAGTPCAWCATWNAARAALAQRQGEGS